MPFVRLITRNFEEGVRVAEQLRAQGHTAEVVSPDDVPSAPADFEIELESVAAADALSHAARLAAAGSEEVFIGSNIFQPPAMPEVQHAATSAVRSVASEVSDLRDRAASSLGNGFARVNGMLRAIAAWPGRRITAFRAAILERQIDKQLAREEREREAEQRRAQELERRRIERDEERARELVTMTAAPPPPPAPPEPKIPVVLSVPPAESAPSATEISAPDVASVPPQQEISAPPVPPIGRRLTDLRRRRTRPVHLPFNRAMLLPLATALTIIAVAFAFALRQPASPLPNSLIFGSSGVTQQLPFGPATAQPAIPPTTAVNPAPPAVRPALPLPKPLARRPKHRRRAANSDVYEDDGPEVVVRHFVSKHPKAVEQSAKSGIRRFSDVGDAD